MALFANPYYLSQASCWPTACPQLELGVPVPGALHCVVRCKRNTPLGGGLRKEIPVIFSVTSPKDPPCNDLPCMGIPGNSHETAISELGIPIGIPKISGPYRIHVLLYRQGYLLSIVDTLACTVVTEISSITRSREMRCCIPSLFSYISSPSLLSSTLTQIVLGKGINLRFIYVVISFFNG